MGHKEDNKKYYLKNRKELLGKMRQYNSDNREKMTEQKRQRYAKLKEIEMLQIHHINGGGTKHIKEAGTIAAIKDMIDNNSYDKYTSLCPNHHNKIGKQ